MEKFAELKKSDQAPQDLDIYGSICANFTLYLHHGDILNKH